METAGSVAIPVMLVVEDELSSTVLSRLLQQYAPELRQAGVLGLQGYGWIKKNLDGINRAAQGMPYFTLFDLDTNECPRALIEEWLRSPQHENHLIRVAVQEVEAWVLSDPAAFSQWIGVAAGEFPEDPESQDPKAAIFRLVSQSKRRLLRDDIIPAPGARIGRDYNGRIGGFVQDLWEPDRARERSASLDRAVMRLELFRDRLVQHH